MSGKFQKRIVNLIVPKTLMEKSIRLNEEGNWMLVGRWDRNKANQNNGLVSIYDVLEPIIQDRLGLAEKKFSFPESMKASSPHTTILYLRCDTDDVKMPLKCKNASLKPGEDILFEWTIKCNNCWKAYETEQEKKKIEAANQLDQLKQDLRAKINKMTDELMKANSKLEIADVMASFNLTFHDALGDLNDDGSVSNVAEDSIDFFPNAISTEIE